MSEYRSAGKNSVGAEVARQLYRGLVRIRCSEETLADLYKQQEMRTPTHFGIGQEAVAVGVATALAKDDVAYSHHRCHNHYLAKGGGVFELAAELYGREAGASRGRGGSVHLTDREAGFIASSAILGQTIPVAVGSALAFKMDGVPRVAVTFFGEAACEEGVFYESLNYASIHRLPVLFVCENNLYSTESGLAVRQPPGTELTERARAFKVGADQVDGNDVFAVFAAAQAALAAIREGAGPRFLECMTYRWREHVGPLFDHEAGRTYRSREEVEAWMGRCPVVGAERRILAEGWASRAEIEDWKAAAKTEIGSAVTRAKAARWPDPSDLFRDID
jgi:TPP-dependent pyruvate/acetoin dehydrogenase alpha subunit